MIDFVGALLKHNLVVLSACALIIFKIVILRLIGDKEAQKLAFLSMPEDLSYVALGLILGDIATSTGAFRKHFRDSQNPGFDIFVSFGLAVFVAGVNHIIGPAVRDHFKSWRAGIDVYHRHKEPLWTETESNASVVPALQGDANAGRNFRTLISHHMYLFGVGYFLQFCVVIYWMIWVAKIIAG